VKIDLLVTSKTLQPQNHHYIATQKSH